MIQFAEESMRGTLRDLWQECFGDSNDYVDFYFQNHEITKHTMVYLDDGQPVSMLSLLPMTVVTKMGILPARYIYAVATKTSHRGRGISTALLEGAHKQMKGLGIKLSVLVPGSGPLYNFYGKRGFETQFSTGRAVVGRDKIPAFKDSFTITDAGTSDFMQVREKAFGGRTMFVRWDGDALAYRLAETAFNGGETLLLSIKDAQAVAVCYYHDGCVLVKELALDGMRVETALGVLQKKYDAQEYHLRLPAGMACPYLVKEAPSGMAYWYDRQARERVLKEKGGAPYISLVLD